MNWLLLVALVLVTEYLLPARITCMDCGADLVQRPLHVTAKLYCASCAKGHK